MLAPSPDEQSRAGCAALLAPGLAICVRGQHKIAVPTARSHGAFSEASASSMPPHNHQLLGYVHPAVGWKLHEPPWTSEQRSGYVRVFMQNGCLRATKVQAVVSYT